MGSHSITSGINAYKHTHTHIHTHIHKYTHTHTHTHTHTLTHTHTHMCKEGQMERTLQSSSLNKHTLADPLTQLQKYMYCGCTYVYCNTVCCRHYITCKKVHAPVKWKAPCSAHTNTLSYRCACSTHLVHLSWVQQDFPNQQPPPDTDSS